MQKKSQQNGSTRDQGKNHFIYRSDHLCLFSSFPSSLSMSMSLSIVHRHHNMFHQIIQSSNISFIISIIHYSDSSFTLKTAGYLPSQTSMRLVPFAWSSLGQVGDGRNEDITQIQRSKGCCWYLTIFRMNYTF